jgi:hypothetical protein
MLGRYIVMGQLRAVGFVIEADLEDEAFVSFIEFSRKSLCRVLIDNMLGDQKGATSLAVEHACRRPPHIL